MVHVVNSIRFNDSVCIKDNYGLAQTPTRFTSAFLPKPILLLQMCFVKTGKLSVTSIDYCRAFLITDR